MSAAFVPSRVELLRQFIATSPEDPFPRYGLALELKNAGQHAEAATEFATLLEKFPTYVPAYLMAGNNLVTLGKTAEAKDVYSKGIQAAIQKGDGHARGELEGALASLRS